MIYLQSFLTLTCYVFFSASLFDTFPPSSPESELLNPFTMLFYVYFREVFYFHRFIYFYFLGTDNPQMFIFSTDFSSEHQFFIFIYPPKCFHLHRLWTQNHLIPEFNIFPSKINAPLIFLTLSITQ